MPLDAKQLAEVTGALVQAQRLERPRLETIRAYMLNAMTDIYVPKAANSEYKMLVDQARFNVLPLVVTAVAQNLFIDGYRPTGENGRAPSSDNAPIWDQVWQPNRMDSRQAGIYRAALTYGYGYTTVLPGKPVPKITPYSPLRLTALYEDPVNDEWPRYAMTVEYPDILAKTSPTAALATAVLGPLDVRVWDETNVYKVRLSTDQAPEVIETMEHGLGVTPVVRFVDQYDLDGCSFGKVEPLLPAQRQLNQTTFGLLMAQQYAAFKQRWATGMAIEEDEEGNPVEPWNAAVNRVWQNESPDGKFGEFSETDLSGYLNSRDKTLLYVSSMAQIPPHQIVIGSGISNISAEALVALQTGHDHDVAEHKTSFGESAEQMLRLAGKATDDADAWEDTSAQVVWRDTTPRSLAQVADALGKLAQQLGIPPEALWEKVPGVTDQDIARWKELRAEGDLMGELDAMLNGQEEEPVAVASSNGADALAPS